MKHAQAYLDNAEKIINAYPGNTPFQPWLKLYFKEHKKFGSTDRKCITELCYHFFRVSGYRVAIPHWYVKQTILVGVGLSINDPNHWSVSLLEPETQAKIHLPIKEKVESVAQMCEASLSFLFPFNGTRLSNGISQMEYSLANLQQPDVFLRIRPGQDKKVLEKLEAHDIPYQLVSNTTIRLNPGVKIESVLELNKEVVVQDLCSQEAGAQIYMAAMRILLQKVRQNGFHADDLDLFSIPIRVWDCCAASGGKSIQLMDSDYSINLTVSDNRSSILENLKKRFKEAGIRQYQAAVLDLEKSIPKDHPLSKQKYDLIIADVPCSGSGTWSRTPEQFYYFKTESINSYQQKQRKILKNIVKQMAPDAVLVYITCSIFYEENEAQVDYIKEELGLYELSRNMHIGIGRKADNLFTAVFSNFVVPTSEPSIDKKFK
jgi:16S rRNA (cytosine967-C5)-methyltransferase